MHDKLVCGLIKIWLWNPVDNDKLKFKADDEKMRSENVDVYVKTSPMPMRVTVRQKKRAHHRHAKMYIIILCCLSAAPRKKKLCYVFLLLIIHNSIKVGSFATTSPCAPSPFTDKFLRSTPASCFPHSLSLSHPTRSQKSASKICFVQKNIFIRFESGWTTWRQKKNLVCDQSEEFSAEIN